MVINEKGVPLPYKRKSPQRSFRTLIRNSFDKKVDYTDLNGQMTTTTAARALVATLWRQAIGGDVRAAKLIIEHLDGRKLIMEDDRNRPNVSITVNASPQEITDFYKNVLKDC